MSLASEKHEHSKSSGFFQYPKVLRDLFFFFSHAFPFANVFFFFLLTLVLVLFISLLYRKEIITVRLPSALSKPVASREKKKHN